MLELRKLIFLVVMSITPVFETNAWADKASLIQQQLEHQSEQVDSGKVISIESKIQKSEAEPASGFHWDLVFTIKLKVNAISKGTGIQAGDGILIEAWRAKMRIPPLPGLQGHDPIPQTGDEVTIYVAQNRKRQIDSWLQ